MDVRWDWAPLVEFIKTELSWDLDVFLADPESYGEKLAEVVENCIQGNSLVEIFDGMVSKPVIVAICVGLAKLLKKE